MALGELGLPAAQSRVAAVLGDDPVPEVRGRAAEALGILGKSGAAVTLRKALGDRAPLVRFFAAKSLLVHAREPGAMEAAFSGLRMENRVLRGRLVGEFLRAFTGLALPPNPARWKNWWKKAREGFRIDEHAEAYALFVEAQKKARQGDESGALELYHELRQRLPRHAGACEEVSKALNSRAWDIAVTGGDLAEGLRLARESVEAKKTANNVDTLAVLLYLTGEKEKAEKTILDFLGTLKGEKPDGLVDRLEEFRTGKLSLR
jgi:hypothetical protein